jgi:hypothetical protein
MNEKKRARERTYLSWTGQERTPATIQVLLHRQPRDASSENLSGNSRRCAKGVSIASKANARFARRSQINVHSLPFWPGGWAAESPPPRLLVVFIDDNRS